MVLLSINFSDVLDVLGLAFEVLQFVLDLIVFSFLMRQLVNGPIEVMLMLQGLLLPVVVLRSRCTLRVLYLYRRFFKDLKESVDACGCLVVEKIFDVVFLLNLR